MLPLLIWLAGEKGQRRYEQQTREELTEAFSDAWSLYRSTKKTPFRKSIISYRSAPTERHVTDKVLPAIGTDDVLIYLYANAFSSTDLSDSVIRLPYGGSLDLKSLLKKIDAASKGCVLIFVDVPNASNVLSGISLSNSTLVCRSAQDFIHATQAGSEPLSSAFAHFFGAAIRHMPIFTFLELIRAITSSVTESQSVRSTLYRVLGNTLCLNKCLSENFPVESPISKEEVENLQSDNLGSFEDGLQSVWGAIDSPEQFEDANALAGLFAVTDRFPNAAISARFIHNRATFHALEASKSVDNAPRMYVEKILSEMIFIPSGTAIIGSNPKKDKYAMVQETPEHMVMHKSFSLSAHHVTVEEWSVFQQALGSCDDFEHERAVANYPITYISFFDARRFADWIDRSAKDYGLIEPDSRIMLPSEAEWEIAARGRKGNIYPWGNEFQPSCNYRENSSERVSAVGSYSPAGDSPFGLKDMAGNVWEWTRSLWGVSGRRPDFRYPYRWNDGRENFLAHSNVRRVVRGGAFYYFDWCLRSATRNVMFPATRHSGGGFRLMKSDRAGAEVFPVVN